MDTRANRFVLLVSLVVSSMVVIACSDAGDDAGTHGPKDAGITPWWDVATAPPSSPPSGDDDSNDAPDAAAPEDASASPDAPVANDDASGGNGGGGDASGGTDASDASSIGALEAGACPAGGTAEIEPNETVAKATAFTNVACGTITPASDVDVWTFTLPANAQHLNLHFDGSVTLTVSSSGDTITVPGSGTMPFHAGAPYTITVRSANTHVQPYVLTLQF